MSMDSYIASLCQQTVVYWANPVNDGFGHFTFDAPVERKCRWENKEQVVNDDKGKGLIYRSIIYLTEDVDTDGLLWLGELADLTPTQQANPHEIPDIMVIKRFEKTPSIYFDSNLRKAFLSPYMY